MFYFNDEIQMFNAEIAICVCYFNTEIIIRHMLQALRVVLAAARGRKILRIVISTLKYSLNIKVETPTYDKINKNIVIAVEHIKHIAVE